MVAANNREIHGGIIYHYYWYGDRAESGAGSKQRRAAPLAWGRIPVAFVSVSGGGVLASSKHPAEAQQLLNFMTSKAGQQILADSNAMEYAVGIDVALAPQR